MRRRQRAGAAAFSLPAGNCTDGNNPMCMTHFYRNSLIKHYLWRLESVYEDREGVRLSVHRQMTRHGQGRKIVHKLHFFSLEYHLRPLG